MGQSQQECSLSVNDALDCTVAQRP